LSYTCITFVIQNNIIMAKESKYGEETKMLSFRVPISLTSEITQMVKLRLLDAEKSNVISGGSIEKKSNTPDIDSSEVGAREMIEEPIAEEEIEVFNPNKNGKIDLLRSIANVSGMKSDMFETKKVNIDDEYDFEIVSSLPDIEYLKSADVKGIALIDIYDVGVYYVKWESRNLKFTDKKEFDRFCKNHLIKIIL